MPSLFNIFVLKFLNKISSNKELNFMVRTHLDGKEIFYKKVNPSLWPNFQTSSKYNRQQFHSSTLQIFFNEIPFSFSVSHASKNSSLQSLKYHSKC